MKRIKKKLLPLMLALALCFGHAMTVEAAGPVTVLIASGVYEYRTDNDGSYKFSDGLMRVRNMNTGKWGYINTAGQLAIPCNYEDAETFSDGVAKVSLGYSRDIGQNIYAFINTAGQMLFSYTHQGFYPQEGMGFSEGYVAVYSDTTYKYGFMNKAGQLVVPCQYREVRNFSDGLAAVYDSANNYWGYVDYAGNPVLPCQYKAAYSFEDGYAVVGAADSAGTWMVIDKSGRNLIPEGYSYYNRPEWNTFSKNGGIVVIQKFDGWYWYNYLLTKEGGIIGPVGGAEYFGDGFGWVGGQLLNTAGQQIFVSDSVYASGKYLGDGYSLLNMDLLSEKQGIVDRDGNLAMLPDGVNVNWSEYYSEGFIKMYSTVTGSARYGYVNMAGQVVVQAKYADGKPFSGGVAPVMNFDYRWGLVDSTGAEVLPLQYTNIDQVKGVAGVFVATEQSGGMCLVVAPPAYAVNGAQVNFMAQTEVNNALNAGLGAEALGGDYRNEITREQIAAAAVKLYEAASGQPAPAVEAVPTPFTDVDNVAVTQAKTLGLIDGLPDGSFVPKATVPREQAAAILSGVSAKLNGTAPTAEQAAKFEPEGSTKKTASIEETLATAARILKKLKK